MQTPICTKMHGLICAPEPLADVIHIEWVDAGGEWHGGEKIPRYALAFIFNSANCVDVYAPQCSCPEDATDCAVRVALARVSGKYATTKHVHTHLLRQQPEVPSPPLDLEAKIARLIAECDDARAALHVEASRADLLKDERDEARRLRDTVTAQSNIAIGSFCRHKLDLECATDDLKGCLVKAEKERDEARALTAATASAQKDVTRLSLKLHALEGLLRDAVKDRNAALDTLRRVRLALEDKSCPPFA